MKAGSLEIEILTNIARLQTEMSVVKRTVGSTMDGVTGDLKRAGAANERYLKSIEDQAVGMTRMGGTARLARHDMLNLGAQINDVIVSLASGQKPLTVFMQQGSQIGQIAASSGVGLRGMAASVGALALPFAPLIPLIAAAGAMIFAFNDRMQQDSGIDAYAASLGLTQEEMKKLGDTSVTTGDMMRGLFTTLGVEFDGFGGTIKGWVVDLGNFFGNVMKGIAAATYGLFVGSYRAIVDTWRQFPAVLADLFVQAVNGAVAGLEWLTNKGVDAVNALGGSLEHVSFGRMNNRFAGAGAAAGKAWGDHLDGAVREATGGIDRFMDRWVTNSQKAARDRLKKDADALKAERAAAGAGSAGAGGGALAQQVAAEQRAFEAATKAARDYIAAQAKSAAQVGLSAKELRLLEDAAQRAKAPTAELREEIDRVAASREAAFAKKADADFRKDVLKPLEDEIKLYGLVGPARASAALGLEKEAFIAKQVAAGVTDAEAAWQQYYDRKTALIAKDEAAAREAESTRRLVEQLDALVGRANNAADAMARAFGRVGGAIGDATVLLAAYGKEQKQIDALREAGKMGGDEAAAKSAQLQLNTTIGLIGATKTFFKERSAGYRIMEAAEKSLAVVQLARTAIDVAGGAAKMFSFLGPFAWPAVGAMLATMAALGFSGGSSVAGPSLPSAKDVQEAQGTGTVLGDSSAKSGSIGNALDLLAENSNRDLEYSSEAVKSLRAIESGIGNLAAAVARETKVGGGLDASALGLGTNTSGGLLGLGGLFSKKVTKELNDSGLQFDGASVASAIAGNISANLYQEILTTTKKSGLFGIGGSTKTTTSTVTSAADAGLTTEVSLLVANMRNAIVSAAGTIGIDGAAAMLDAFQINIGRISFKDLTSEEIESELAAVFSRVGDDMAGAVGGAVAEYQRAGEGMLETLTRLAKEYQTVDVTLRSIGMTFGSVGLASVGARTALVELFGGLDEFTEATSFFRENFLSEAEQMAPVIAAVRAEMTRLGQTGVDTKDEFKALVLGLDLSSESGRETYAALMAVSPAFAKTSDYLASLNGELKETAKTAEQLAAIEKQRRSLEIQLMEATGDTAGALAAKRADEVAGLDESLRAIQLQIYAATDAAQAARDLAAANEAAARATDEATRAAEALAQQRRGLEVELMEATGNAAGALAARRTDEIAALDASLRPIKEAILAAQDATAAQEALAAAQAEAAQTAAALAQARRGMEIELMEALGDASGALAARRADELAGTDASLRALREQIFAAQDAATANAALAQAQQDAASAAASAAAQVAAAVAQIASQRSSLEIQLMRAQGNEAGAVSAERDLQLAATDESLRGLQQQVWAAEDARKAAEEAARAQVEYAQQMQQAAQAAQQAAQDAEQLRRQRAGMDAQLLDLLGNSAGALALRRQEELAALDASLRPLQQSIYAQEDLAAAATAAADRVNDARSVLTDAYKRESDALQQTIDTMGGLGESLRKYRAELAGGDAAAGNAYLAALGQLNVTDAKAARGDAGALAALEAAGKDFLTVSRDQAGSLLDYQRDVARVAAAVDRGIGATDEAVDYAQAQLDALKNSVAGLIDVNESVISVRDAITALQVAIAGNPVPTVPAAPVTATSGGGQPVQVNTAELERRIDSLSARLEVQNTAVAENTGRMARFMARWDDDGLPTRDVEAGA